MYPVPVPSLYPSVDRSRIPGSSPFTVEPEGHTQRVGGDWGFSVTDTETDTYRGRIGCTLYYSTTATTGGREGEFSESVRSLSQVLTVRLVRFPHVPSGFVLSFEGPGRESDQPVSDRDGENRRDRRPVEVRNRRGTTGVLCLYSPRHGRGVGESEYRGSLSVERRVDTVTFGAPCRVGRGTGPPTWSRQQVPSGVNVRPVPSPKTVPCRVCTGLRSEGT